MMKKERTQRRRHRHFKRFALFAYLPIVAINLNVKWPAVNFNLFGV
jgi:hypothetical protein